MLRQRNRIAIYIKLNYVSKNPSLTIFALQHRPPFVPNQTAEIPIYCLSFWNSRASFPSQRTQRRRNSPQERSSCSSSSTVGTISRLPTISYAIFVNLLGFGLAGLVRIIREGTISGNDRLLAVGNRRKVAEEVIVVKNRRLMLRRRALRVT
jgi:hypothetical protein